MENKSAFSDKSFILWGRARHVFEMEFMFPELDFLGYIPSDDEKWDITMPEMQMDCLVKSDNILFVVCDTDAGRYEGILKEKDFLYGEDYLLFSDLFYLLDDFNETVVAGRKIAVWGVGDTARNLHKDCRANNYSIEVDIYIDGSAERKTERFNGKPVYMAQEMNDIGQYFIVVASIFYFDIKERLERMGLQEGRDFLPFSKFSSKPSDMMKKQVNAAARESFHCGNPNTWFYYAWFGTYCCCSTWVDYPIGNPATELPGESWNSVVARLYRLSADTRTYCFCKEDACGIWKKKITYGFKEFSQTPQHIVLGLDTTCNLFCTSCRDCLKATSGEQLRIREVFADNILDTGWLDKTNKLELSGSGEALLSKIDRRLLFSEKGIRRNSISLITNGNLFNRANWEKLKNTYKEIAVNVSVDAATEKTYNMIRRGGNWRVLSENLGFLSQLRADNEVKYVEIRMVVQRNNYKEIVPFIKMGRDYGFDRVVFTKLLNWDMYTAEEYEYESMISAKGELHPELREVLQYPEMSDPIVNADEFIGYLDNAKQ